MNFATSRFGVWLLYNPEARPCIIYFLYFISFYPNPRPLSAWHR